MPRYRYNDDDDDDDDGDVNYKLIGIGILFVLILVVILVLVLGRRRSSSGNNNNNQPNATGGYIPPTPTVNATTTPTTTPTPSIAEQAVAAAATEKAREDAAAAAAAAAAVAAARTPTTPAVEPVFEVRVGSSSGRHKSVTVPATVRVCPTSVTMGTDRYWTQLYNNELHVYRLDANSGWGNDLTVQCNGGLSPGDARPSDERVFIGDGAFDGLAWKSYKERTVELPRGTVCKSPCDRDCRYTGTQYDDLLCNTTSADGRLTTFFRCNADGSRKDDTFRFNLEMPWPGEDDRGEPSPVDAACNHIDDDLFFLVSRCVVSDKKKTRPRVA